MLDNILLLLLVSMLTTLLLRRFQLPAMLGYLTVGILLGPHALGWVNNLEGIADSAEWGVVFLMFMIGLEFSRSQLWAMKSTVFVYGGAMVFISVLLTIVIGNTVSLSLAESLVLGGIIAMSSTAIVVKQLMDQTELNLRHGVDALSILLFQDLAVIPLMILIPALQKTTGFTVFHELAFALAKACFVLVLMLSLGRWALGPIFYKISKYQSDELFTLTTLFITLGSAWLTHQLGLSFALGSFLAGIMLAETTFKHRIELDIRPFRDLLLGLFFISVGMQFKISLLWLHWQTLLCLLLMLVSAKYAVILSIGLYLKKRTVETASRTAFCLAQGGEFGFALLNLAAFYGIVSVDHEQWILGTLILSMAIAPLMVSYNGKLSRQIVWRLGLDRQRHPHDDVIPMSNLTRGLEHHVILCGYGRVGQLMANCLHQAKIPYIALDSDVEKIKKAHTNGKRVYYANARDYTILKKVHLDKAKALVIAFSDQSSALIILRQIRQNHPLLPVIVRAYNEEDAHIYHQEGATEIVPEILEAGLTLTRRTLTCMGVEKSAIDAHIRQAEQDYTTVFQKTDEGE